MKLTRGTEITALRIPGHFVRDLAERARQLVARSKYPFRFVADLSAVSYIDAVGEEVLIWFKEVGMKFKANSAISRRICDRLQLPMVGTQARKSHYASGTDREHSVIWSARLARDHDTSNKWTL